MKSLVGLVSATLNPLRSVKKLWTKYGDEAISRRKYALAAGENAEAFLDPKAAFDRFVRSLREAFGNVPVVRCARGGDNDGVRGPGDGFRNSLNEKCVDLQRRAARRRREFHVGDVVGQLGLGLSEIRLDIVEEKGQHKKGQAAHDRDWEHDASDGM